MNMQHHGLHGAEGTTLTTCGDADVLSVIARRGPDLVIARGLPGSGKSTLALVIAARLDFLHFETDMFLETPDGYSFSPERLEAAKIWCFNAVGRALECGTKAVVSNVFDRIEHMERFLCLSSNCLVIECTQQYGSVHSVPETVVEAMRASWEPYPGAVQV